MCWDVYSLLVLEELVEGASAAEARARVTLEVLGEGKVDNHLCLNVCDS